MSNAYLSPILQQSQFDDNGNFLAGGLIWSYVAGTTTPLTVYTTSDASTAWPNPIVLDARGECGGEIWLAAGSSYKFVLEGAPQYGQTHGPVVSTFDEVTGVNDTVTVPSTNNWIEFTGTPTYISATSFSVAGDQRTTFQVYRRLRSSNSAGTIYSSILTSTYSTGITTVTVLNDTGTLDSGLSSVYYSFVETDPSAIPPPFASGTRLTFAQAAAPFGWTQVTTYNDYALRLVNTAGAGTGGSIPFTTAFFNGNVGSTTLTTSQIPSHNHLGNFSYTYAAMTGVGPVITQGIQNTSTPGQATFTSTMTTTPYNVANDGGGGSHTHTINVNVRYLDLILCEKD
jgi:microcystin-dependent protein